MSMCPVTDARMNCTIFSVLSVGMCFALKITEWDRLVNASVGSTGAMWFVIIVRIFNVTLPIRAMKVCHGAVRDATSHLIL